MGKSYQEQAIAFIMKAIVAAGSIYLIVENFIGQVDHLFHLDSIKTAVFIFHLIYFAAPMAVVLIYFLFKKGSMKLYGKPANSTLAAISGIYLTFTMATFYIPVTSAVFIGIGLVMTAFVFLCLSLFIRKSKEHKKEMVQYLSIGFIIIIFACSYLIRNDSNARKFETKYFSNAENHFAAIDSIDSYTYSSSNVFEPGVTNDTILSNLKNDLDLTGQISKKELIRIGKNRYGLYINLLSYKALIIVLPFSAIIIGFIFLFTTNVPKPFEPTLIRRKGDDYEVIIGTTANTPERDFLKVIFVVLITLCIPILHPLETIKSEFPQPVSFWGNPEKPTQPTKPQYDRLNNKKDSLYSTIINLPNYGDIIILSPTAIDKRNNKLTNNTSIDSIKIAIENLNENIILFSTFFGQEEMNSNKEFNKGVVANTRPKPVQFYQRIEKLKTNVYKK